MLAVIKRPGEAPAPIAIENTLEALQEVVGGYIETVQITSDCAIVRNGEGKIMNLPHNITFMGEDFVGTILFVGVKNVDFCSLSLASVPVLCRGLPED